jgi:phage terminase small subunit
MAPPRKPLAHHVASGAIAKNPGRFVDRTDPPEPKAPIKRAPKHLDEAQQKVWKELVSQAPDGLLGTCDAVLLEIAVRLTVKMRTGQMEKTSEFISLANVLNKLGLTPSGRANFNGPVPEKPRDDLDELD